MIRFIFRVLATLSLAIAVIMAVLDATRSIAADAVMLTPLSESWRTISPGTFEAAGKAIGQLLTPQLWDPVALTLLSAPGFALFLVLALVFYMIGRRPERPASRFVSI